MDSDLYLSTAEIVKMTGYKRPAAQLRMLASLNIPARRRVDNTVLVLRMHCIHPATMQQKSAAPKLKSSR